LLRCAEEAEKRAAEAKKRKVEAKRREAEAKRREVEVKKREEEAQRQLSKERAQTRKTTLPEFLDACHVHLFLGLAIELDPDSSTNRRPGKCRR
jgi:sRNA-binding protein